MKDQRVTLFTAALEGLMESLDATVRIMRWKGAEGVPEPLKVSAAKLLDRLGKADRLANGSFSGTPADTAKVTAMCTAMKRLDAAYVAYRQALDTAPSQSDEAALALDAEIDEVKGDARRWG